MSFGNLKTSFHPILLPLIDFLFKLPVRVTSENIDKINKLENITI